MFFKRNIVKGPKVDHYHVLMKLLQRLGNAIRIASLANTRLRYVIDADQDIPKEYCYGL